MIEIKKNNNQKNNNQKNNNQTKTQKKISLILFSTLFIVLSLNFIFSFEDYHYDIFKCDKDGDGLFQLYDIKDHETCKIINSKTAPFNLDYFDSDPNLKDNISLKNGINYTPIEIRDFYIGNFSKFYNEKRGEVINSIKAQINSELASGIDPKIYSFLKETISIIPTLDLLNNNDIIAVLENEEKEIPIIIKLLITAPRRVPKFCLKINDNVIKNTPFEFEEESASNIIYKIEKWTALNYNECNLNVSIQSEISEKKLFLFCKKNDNYENTTYVNQDIFDLENCYFTNNENVKNKNVVIDGSEIIGINETAIDEAIINETAIDEAIINETPKEELIIYEKIKNIENIKPRVSEFSNELLVKKEKKIEITNTNLEIENKKIDLTNKINSQIILETNVSKVKILEDTKKIVEENKIIESKSSLEIKSIENLTEVSIKFDYEFIEDKENYRIIQNIDKSLINSASTIIYDKTKYSMEILIDDPLIMWNFLDEEELKNREIKYYVEEEIDEVNEEDMEVLIINVEEPLSSKETDIENEILDNSSNENKSKKELINETVDEIVTEIEEDNDNHNENHDENHNENQHIEETNHEEINETENEKENMISILLALSIIPLIIFLLVFFEKFKKKKESHEQIYPNEPQNNYYQDINDSTNNDSFKINAQQKQKLYNAINKLNK